MRFPRIRSRLTASFVVALVVPSSVAVAAVVGSRVVQGNGVVSTYGDPVADGDVELAWSTHEWIADLAEPAVVAQAPTEDVVLVVSPSGADSADGSAGSPLRTIRAAMDRVAKVNAKGQSVRVVIEPGTYREAISLYPSSAATSAAIVLEGRGVVTISGADVHTDWTAVGPGVYATAWSHDWGIAEMPGGWAESYAADELAANPVIRRRELVFVDGRRLTPVTERADLDRTPDSFQVDEAANRILVRSTTDPRKAQVEIAERDLALIISGRSNVTVSNLRFVKTATKLEQKAVQINESAGIRIVDSIMQDNSWYGLGLYKSDDVIILRTRATDNGSGGMTAFGATNVLFEDTETSRNNWRGATGQADHTPGTPVDLNFVDWAGGQKFFRLDGAVFRRHRSSDNQSSGLWFDYDNRNVAIEDAVITGNRTWGIFFEASPGPLAIRRSTLRGNEYGVMIGNSEDGVIADSTIAGNLAAQIFVAGEAARTIYGGPAGEQTLRSQGWTVTGNTIGASDSKDAIRTHLGAGPWSVFTSTLNYSGNAFTGRG